MDNAGDTALDKGRAALVRDWMRGRRMASEEFCLVEALLRACGGKTGKETLQEESTRLSWWRRLFGLQSGAKGIAEAL
jgi:hypothetical protein